MFLLWDAHVHIYSNSGQQPDLMHRFNWLYGLLWPECGVCSEDLIGKGLLLQACNCNGIICSNSHHEQPLSRQETI